VKEKMDQNVSSLPLGMGKKGEKRKDHYGYFAERREKGDANRLSYGEGRKTPPVPLKRKVNPHKIF